MDELQKIFDAIQADNAGEKPLYSAHKEATICIIGQAPGAKTVEAGVFWKDASGDRLRDWLGMTEAEFYSTNKLAILPMDFYFPGKGKSGDLPPRKDFAEKWHPQLLALMPEIELTLLIGNYAQNYYLHSKATATANVKNFRDFLPQGYFPLVHPSPRNNIWLAKNPWYEVEVLPELKKHVKELLK